MPASSRCAVVGAGIVGLAIARELQARGFEVIVYERSGVGAGASGVQPGGVRQQWGTRVACRLARESVAFWRDIDARLKPRVPLELRRRHEARPAGRRRGRNRPSGRRCRPSTSRPFR